MCPPTKICHASASEMGSATLFKSGVAMSLLIIVHATLCAIQRALDAWDAHAPIVRALPLTCGCHPCPSQTATI